MGTEPLLVGEQEPILPPVTDDLVLHLDVGVGNSMDGVEANGWKDTASLQGLSSFLEQTPGAVLFRGTPAPAGQALRGHGTYLEVIDGANANWVEQAPLSDLESLHWDNFGPWTIVMVLKIGPPTSTNHLIGNGNAQYNSGWHYYPTTNGVQFRLRNENVYQVNLEYNLGAPWDLTGKVRVLTLAGDSNNASGGFAKIDGVAKVPGATDHTNNQRTARTPELFRLGNFAADDFSRFYTVLYYKRTLTDAEITQVEDFYKGIYDPTDQVLGTWAIENIDTIGNIWQLYDFAPAVDGVIQNDIAEIKSVDGWANLFRLDGVADNNFATSDNSIISARQASVSLIYNRSLSDVNQIALYHDRNLESGREPPRKVIKVSDNQGISYNDLMLIKTYDGFASNSGQAPDTHIFYDLPDAALQAETYSLEAKSIIARWPAATQAERDALATFIQTLDTANILDHVIEFWPLFLTNEAASRRSAFRNLNDLAPFGAAAHIPGVGWDFPGNDDYMAMGDRLTDVISSPHSTTRNLALTNHLSAATRESRDYFGIDGTDVFKVDFTTAGGGRTRAALFRTGLITASDDTGLTDGHPVNIACTWFKASDVSADRMSVRRGANAVNLISSNVGTTTGLGTIDIYFPGCNNNGVHENSLTSTWNFLMLTDMNSLTEADTLTINNAVDQLMIDVGIKT